MEVGELTRTFNPRRSSLFSLFWKRLQQRRAKLSLPSAFTSRGAHALNFSPALDVSVKDCL